MALNEKYVTADSDGGDGSLGNPWTLSEAIAGCAAGDRINILSGTYTRTASDTIATAGTVGSPIIFRGVTSFSPLTPITPTRTNGGALVTTGMPVIAYDATYSLLNNSAYTILDSLSITGSVNGTLVTCNVLVNSVMTNSANNSSARCWTAAGAGTCAINCDGFLTGATYANYVFATTAVRQHISNCRASNQASSGQGCYYLLLGSFHNLVCLPSAGTGIVATDMGSTITNCTIYGQAVGIATPNSSQTISLKAQNCIFAGNTVAISNPYNATAAHPLVSVNNCYYNNTNANLGFGDWPEQGRIDLASDPFVDAANGDFRLKPGSAARNAGLGGVDCGAIQHVDPTQPATTTVWFGTSYNDGLSTGEMRASDIENCEAGNIKKDVVIDDVTGTMEHTGFVGVKAK